ncbi:MAG TPA: glycosyltransferase family 9 protein, partial [Gemmatimonadaceae bacterium]
WMALTLPTRRARRHQQALAGPLRILVIAEDAVGDTILTMPAIRAMHDAHPGNVVDVLTWPAAGQLFENVDYVRRTIVFPRYDRRRMNALKAVRQHGPYDVVVDAMVLVRHIRSRTFAMMLASGARYWAGENSRGNEYLLNVSVPRPVDLTPYRERMLSLATPFGGDEPDQRPKLVVSLAEQLAAAHMWGDGSPRVLVNVSTNGPERRWEPSRYAAVVRHLARRLPTARIVIVSLDHDRRIADNAVASHASRAHLRSHDRVHDRESRVRATVPTLRELVALVESSDLIFSPDTAVSHLASAFRRPLISMHTAGTAHWQPYDTPGRRVVSVSRTGLEMITARRVMSAIDDVLAEMGMLQHRHKRHVAAASAMTATSSDLDF